MFTETPVSPTGDGTCLGGRGSGHEHAPDAPWAQVFASSSRNWIDPTENTISACIRHAQFRETPLQQRYRAGSVATSADALAPRYAPKRAIGEDKLPNAMSVPAHVSQPGCVVVTRAQLGQIHPVPHLGRTNRRVCPPASAPAILRLDLAEGHATSSSPKPTCEMNTMRVINMPYRHQRRHGSARNAKDAFLQNSN